MEALLQTLNDIQPILMIGSLVLFYTVEAFLPYFGSFHKGRHTVRNLALLVLTLAVNIAFSFVFAGGILWANSHHFGLLQWIPIPWILQVILGILTLDLGSYVLHIITHKVPFLWRYHRVHHSDTEVDSTTGFRFHPFEIAMQNIWQTGFQVLTGMPMASAILYYTFFLPWLVAEHANIKFPAWFEKYTSYIIVTPGWHKVHHSANKPETDSHYSDLFTIWDRLFGTTSRVNPDKIEYGIEQFRNDKEQTVLQQLLVPFKPLKD